MSNPDLDDHTPDKFTAPTMPESQRVLIHDSEIKRTLSKTSPSKNDRLKQQVNYHAQRTKDRQE